MATEQRMTIPDLLSPVLSDDQRTALEEAERSPVDLSVEGVLSTARERARLHDFGSDDFLERLALLLEVTAWEGHTRLTQERIVRRMTEKAINRLLTVELLRRHPEIRDEPIEAPLIIAGLPRSGTTHLLNLIAADSRFQSTPYWEVLRPVPLLPEDAPGADGIDPRWARAEQGWERMSSSNPYAAAHHPMNADHISEDGELQMADFSSYVWEFSLRAPQWRDYYYAHDQTPHYEYEKTMLQILQWQRGSRARWIVKAPQHLEQLRPIMNVFPDATVVITHRDPVASLQSILTMRIYGGRTRERVLDFDYDLAYWVERYGHLLDSYLADIDVVPERQRFDCIFRDFMSDDVAMVERIYATAGLEMTAQARAELDAYMVDHQRGAQGSVVTSMRTNFGIDPASIRDRYREYSERVDTGIEAR